MLSTSSKKLQMGTRQPLSKVMLGGAQGRSQMMHGGMGAKAGGANAVGTGRTWKSWNSAKTGGQATPSNKSVKTWNSWTPKGSKEATYKKGKAPKPWYLDASYTRNMAEHGYNKDMMLAEVKAGLAQQRMQKARGLRDLSRMYQMSRTNAAATHGAAGLGSSGIQARAQQELSRDFNTGTSDIGKDYAAAVAAMNRQAELAKSRYSSSKAGEIGLAKQRWRYLNPGMAPPR